MVRPYGSQRDNHFSTDLELLALFDDNCTYLNNFVTSEYGDRLDLSLDRFDGRTHDAAARLFEYEERVLGSDNIDEQKYNFEEEMFFLGMSEDILLRGETNVVTNRSLERIEELRSRLGEQERASAGKPKNLKKENSDEFPTPTVYSCRYCPKEFYSTLACHHHQVCHAKKLLQCSYCKQRTRSNSSLRRHMEYFHCPSKRREIFFDYR